jgi:hypothetical protein
VHPPDQKGTFLNQKSPAPAPYSFSILQICGFPGAKLEGIPRRKTLGDFQEQKYRGFPDLCLPYLSIDYDKCIYRITHPPHPPPFCR